MSEPATRRVAPAAGGQPTRRVLLAATPALAAAAVLGRAGAARAAPPSDVEQLERLLALEHRLEAAYEGALRREAIEPRLGEALRAHEREHVRGLGEALSGYGRRAPRASVPPPGLGPALADGRAFARFAHDLEADTVAAYQEVLATLRNVRLLQPLGAIMAAGAQHQVALRRATGGDLLRSRP